VAFDFPPKYPPNPRLQADESLFAYIVPLTDIGRKRKNNEDNYLVFPLNGKAPSQTHEEPVFSLTPGMLLAVADGMGGHQSGDVASLLCVQHLGPELAKRLPERRAPRQEISVSLREAVEATHQIIYHKSRLERQHEGMGSTLTAAIIERRRVFVAQVGDSRAYIFHKGTLTALTEDQTLGNLLRVAEGSVLAGRAHDILIQAMGAQPELRVAVSEADLAPSDFLLLCSDGLYKEMQPSEIVEILGGQIPLRAKAEALIARANENGGSDNVTVVLTQILPPGGPAA